MLINEFNNSDYISHKTFAYVTSHICAELRWRLAEVNTLSDCCKATYVIKCWLSEFVVVLKVLRLRGMLCFYLHLLFVLYNLVALSLTRIRSASIC